MPLATNTVNTTKDQEWSMIIRPSRGLFDLRLKEIWHYRDLLFLLVRRDVVTVYKQTLLGAFWFILPPILNTAIYFILFGVIAKVPTDGINPILFYLSGLIAWGYFADCINRTSQTFRANASVFGKVYFPRLIVPLSSVMSAVIKFGVQLVLLIVTLAFFVIKGDTANKLKYFEVLEEAQVTTNKDSYLDFIAKVEKDALMAYLKIIGG